MSKVLITRSKLDTLATSISTKSGAALPLTLDQMNTAVQSISGGGVDTSSDTVDAAHLLSGYTAHDSNGDQITGEYVPSAPTLETVTKSYTPTESAQSETVSAGTGYDGIDTVSISVGAISSTYVGSGITSRSSIDLSASGATVTAPAGYYASAATKSVASMTLPSAASSTSSGTSKATITPGSAAQYLNIPTGYNDTTSYYTIAAGGSSVKTATGTFTGNGTRTIDVSCDWEPDLVYFTSDPGTTASSGTVAAIIVRGMMTATRYRNNSTTNSHYEISDIANMNSSGSSYSWRATYANSKVTLYCYSSNARGLLTNGRTYSYTFMKWT